MPTAIVTGGTGFLGAALVDRLVDEGWDVVPLARSGGTVAGCEVRPVDVCDAEELDDVFESVSPTVVFHLAASIPNSFDHDDSISAFVPNVQGMLNVLEAARNTDVEAVVYASSSVYGPETDGLLTEKTPVVPFNFYSTSKYVGDVLCEQYRNEGELSTFALRISAPYGPGNDSASVLNIFIERALDDRPILLYGSGQRRQDFTYVSDVVDAFLLAAQRRSSDTGGTYNIASGRSVSMRELAETVVDVVPDCTSDIERADKPDPQEGYRPRYDISKAERELGYEPSVSLEDGIEACIDAMAE